MGRKEKLLTKLQEANNTYPWSDLVTLLKQLGYEKEEMAGSRIRFYHQKRQHMIRLHKPHPANEIKGGALRDIRNQFEQEGYL